jgi:hypothetical protein
MILVGNIAKQMSIPCSLFIINPTCEKRRELARSNKSIRNTYPLRTKTEVYSFKPIRLRSSSTVEGQAFRVRSILLFIALPPPPQPPFSSGITSTLINLKCPTRPLRQPFQTPEAFIESTSIISPFCIACKKERNLVEEKRGKNARSNLKF